MSTKIDVVRFRDGDIPNHIEGLIIQGSRTHRILKTNDNENVAWNLQEIRPICSPDSNIPTMISPTNPFPLASPVFTMNGDTVVTRVAIRRSYVATPHFTRAVQEKALALASGTALIRTDNAAARRIEQRKTVFGTLTQMTSEGKAILTKEEYEERFAKEKDRRQKKAAARQAHAEKAAA
eukprot:PhF_6_TR31699/c0_g1_i1/m.46641